MFVSEKSPHCEKREKGASVKEDKKNAYCEKVGKSLKTNSLL